MGARIMSTGYLSFAKGAWEALSGCPLGRQIKNYLGHPKGRWWRHTLAWLTVLAVSVLAMGGLAAPWQAATIAGGAAPQPWDQVRRRRGSLGTIIIVMVPTARC